MPAGSKFAQISLNMQRVKGRETRNENFVFIAFLVVLIIYCCLHDVLHDSNNILHLSLQQHRYFPVSFQLCSLFFLLSFTISISSVWKGEHSPCAACNFTIFTCMTSCIIFHVVDLTTSATTFAVVVSICWVWVIAIFQIANNFLSIEHWSEFDYDPGSHHRPLTYKCNSE